MHFQNIHVNQFNKKSRYFKNQFRNLALYLKLRACAAKTGRFKDTAGRSACALSTFHFHQCLEICSAVHLYWHWLAGWGDGERRVGVKTAGDSQKEPVVVELR